RAVGPSKSVFIFLRRTWGLSVGEGTYGELPLVFIPLFEVVTSVFISLLLHHPPNGIGPRCSARGPSAVTGRKSSAPTIKIVPNSRKANVVVLSLRVPNPTGLVFFMPRNAAIATIAMIG